MRTETHRLVALYWDRQIHGTEDVEVARVFALLDVTVTEGDDLPHLDFTEPDCALWPATEGVTLGTEFWPPPVEDPEYGREVLELRDHLHHEEGRREIAVEERARLRERVALLEDVAAEARALDVAPYRPGLIAALRAAGYEVSS